MKEDEKHYIQSQLEPENTFARSGGIPTHRNSSLRFAAEFSKFLREKFTPEQIEKMNQDEKRRTEYIKNQNKST